MKILIDGDSCSVFKIAESIAKAHKIPCVFVCDYAKDPPATSYTQIKQVDVGFNSADMYIANNTESGDIVITNDTGLAALVLAKQGIAINNYGFEFTNGNINSMLMARELYAKARRRSSRNNVKSNLKTGKQGYSFPVTLKKVIKRTRKGVITEHVD